MYISKKFIFLIIIFLCGIFYLFFLKKTSNTYTFQQIDSFEQAIPGLNQCDAQTLVLFDIDDTLISTTDIMGTKSPPLLFKLKAILKHPQLLFKKNWEYYYSIMWQQTEWHVIEPDSITIINHLKDRGCIALGLTSMETGSFGVIENFPEWRSALLADFGIKFTDSFLNIVFNDLQSYRNNYPELYDGILCCNQQSKGSVVAAFLNHFNLQPTKIIFFDDSADNLASVAAVCKQRDIPFTGFQYKGAEKLAKKWDMQKALMQLDYLIDHGTWISDKAIAASRFHEAALN